MSYCKKCNVTVRGNTESCPLCQANLLGDTTKPLYPRIVEEKNKLSLFMRLLALATGVICIVSVLINAVATPQYRWSYFVIFGTFSFWLSFSYAVKKRRKLAKNIIMQAVLASVVCVAWDVYTGFHGWSLDYVIPCATGAAIIAISLLARILKLPASDYIYCLLWDIVFGLIPLILWLTGRLTILLPSAICIGLSLFTIISIALFQRKEIKLEIQKRFHM